MKNKCPYCLQPSCVETVVFSNCEAYKFEGTSYYTLPCKHCAKIIEVKMEKTISVSGVYMSSKTIDECDW